MSFVPFLWQRTLGDRIVHKLETKVEKIITH